MKIALSIFVLTVAVMVAFSQLNLRLDSVEQLAVAIGMASVITLLFRVMFRAPTASAHHDLDCTG
jgi:hypothetical protein